MKLFVVYCYYFRLFFYRIKMSYLSNLPSIYFFILHIAFLLTALICFKQHIIIVCCQWYSHILLSYHVKLSLNLFVKFLNLSALQLKSCKLNKILSNFHLFFVAMQQVIAIYLINS